MWGRGATQPLLTRQEIKLDTLLQLHICTIVHICQETIFLRNLFYLKGVCHEMFKLFFSYESNPPGHAQGKQTETVFDLVSISPRYSNTKLESGQSNSNSISFKFEFLDEIVTKYKIDSVSLSGKQRGSIREKIQIKNLVTQFL